MKSLLILLAIYSSTANPKTLLLSTITCVNAIHSSLNFAATFDQATNGKGYVNFQTNHAVISVKNTDPAWFCRIS